MIDQETFSVEHKFKQPEGSPLKRESFISTSFHNCRISQAKPREALRAMIDGIYCYHRLIEIGGEKMARDAVE